MALSSNQPTAIDRPSGCSRAAQDADGHPRPRRDYAADDEPGVLMTFEENDEEIASDVASLGFDLPELIEAQKLAVDYVRVERSEIEETGEHDLEGLFVRLDYAIRTVGAKRVVLDTIESLFAGLKNDAILAVRTATAVPVAEGPGRDRRDHGRARRGP